MIRVKMIVAYDGTNYCGWQIQSNGNTIEAELNKHLSELFKERIQVIGASRTDSGVHALYNIAVFDTSSKMPANKVAFALNQRLPEDIRVHESKEVDKDYHPRHQQSIKTYHYKIENAIFPTPTLRLYTHFTNKKLDLQKMQQAAQFFVGEHDFKSFCSIATQAETTIRTITAISLTKENRMITISISGTGFLYNMVRIIVGTLLEIGMGKYEPEMIKEILLVKDRKKAGPTAPAKGLLLYSYEFLGKK